MLDSKVTSTWCAASCVCRGVLLTSDQHRKHCDSPCCPGDVTVQFVTSFFSLSSLNGLSLWSENKSLLSRPSMCDSLQGNLFLCMAQKGQQSYTTAYCKVGILTHDGHTCTHGTTNIYTSKSAFTNANAHTQKNTCSHAFLLVFVYYPKQLLC